MATSRKQLDANRRNAQSSTGPRTPEGKSRSSRNATTHGLLASTLPLDDPAQAAAFTEHLELLHASYAPATYEEALLVTQLAHAYWKQDRLEELSLIVTTRFQAAASPPPPDPTKGLSPMERLQALSNGTFTIREPPIDKGAATAALNALCRYTSTIQRSLDRTRATLRALQAERRQQEAEAQEPPPQPNEPTAPLSPPPPAPNEAISPAPTAEQEPSERPFTPSSPSTTGHYPPVPPPESRHSPH